MSDTPPPADGWRQGEDGKWYGPDDDPSATAAPTPPDADGADLRSTPLNEEDSGDGNGNGRRRAVLIGGVAAAVVLVGVTVLVLASGSDDPTLTGEFSLSDTDSISGSAESCRGTGGYSDFGPGMNVTVRDGSGEIIASSNTTSLDVETYFGSDESSELEDEARSEGDDDMDPEELADLMFDVLGCTVTFEVQVPEADFYAIEVGRRGELSYSRDELAERDWNVSLTLGD